MFVLMSYLYLLIEIKCAKLDISLTPVYQTNYDALCTGSSGVNECAVGQMVQQAYQTSDDNPNQHVCVYNGAEAEWFPSTTNGNYNITNDRKP